MTIRTSAFARRVLPIALMALASMLLANRASAFTTITGGNIINQTWTTAGSPYIIQGDITVPSGSSLTMDPGITVQFASTDSQAAGRDASRVELTINGTLAINGTTINPVVLQAQSGTSARTWYGIVVTSAAASAVITGATIQHAINGVESAAPGSVLSVSSTAATTNSNAGFWISAGTPTLNQIRSTANFYGIYFTSSGAGSVVNSLIYANSSYGVYDARSALSPTVIDVTGTTINANGIYGIYSSPSAPSAQAINVKNSIITNHTTYGVSRSGLGSGTITVTYSDVWSNATNYSNVSPGIGTFSCNPLYVSPPSNLRLTSNSPARFAGDTAADIGAMPYVSDATPGLYGKLWSNLSLPASGSPYTVAGDLIVAPGVALTVDPGVTVNFGTSDIMACGFDPGRSELSVAGSLVAAGTKSQGIMLSSFGSGASSWFGVHLTAGSASILDYVTIEKGVYGVLYQASGADTIRRSTFQTCTYGLRVVAGTATVDAIIATGNIYGVYVSDSGQLNLTSSILRANSTSGYYLATTGSNLSETITNCTIHANGSYGIAAPSLPGQVAINVKNSIVSSHTSYGIYHSGTNATVNVTYSDVWGNATNYLNVTPGTGTISQNPNFVSSTDLHLQASSVCIDAGTSAGAPATDLDGASRPMNGDTINGAEFDIGAYEFGPSVLVAALPPSGRLALAAALAVFGAFFAAGRSRPRARPE